MKLKIRKNLPLIDQHDKNFMYGGKFGGNFIPETLKKPIDDLTKLNPFGMYSDSKISSIILFKCCLSSFVKVKNCVYVVDFNLYFLF